MRVKQENVVRIYGSEGSIFLPDPFVPARNGGTARILVRKRGQAEPQEIAVQCPRPLYSIEADTVAAHIAERQAPSPAMTWEDSLGNMKSLDRWRQAVGVVYDAEKPGANRLPVHRRPLAVRKDHRMKFGRIPGIESPVSRLVMGADNQTTLPMAQVMFDDFFESGGNCFDTAWIYGGGACEKVLGQWVKDRNIRRQVILIDKGAHTPSCNPKDLTAQLMQSLERLQTDYLDIYMMHRDNPEIPVGEFVDVMNEHQRAGRIRVFGGSNWSLERVEAANEYAAHAQAGRLRGGQQQLQSGADGRGAVEGMPGLLRRALARVVPPHADDAHALVEPGARLFRRRREPGEPLGRGTGPLLVQRG